MRFGESASGPARGRASRSCAKPGQLHTKPKSLPAMPLPSGISNAMAPASRIELAIFRATGTAYSQIRTFIT